MTVNTPFLSEMECLCVNAENRSDLLASYGDQITSML